MPVKIQRFFRLTRAELFIFILACIISIKHSIITAILPMRSYMSKMGDKGKESPHELIINELVYAKTVELTIRRVQKYLPFKIKCFAAALTAKELLAKRNIHSTIYLGVKKGNGDKMIAHAWLRCGDIIVTGKEEMGNFTSLVFFS